MGKNRKWSSLGKHWRKPEKDLLAANTCKSKEYTSSSAKEGDVSFRSAPTTKVTLSLLNATLGTLSSWHTEPESDWPSQRPFAWSEGLRGPCSFPTCFPGRAAGFTSTAIRLFTGSSSQGWKKGGDINTNTKHQAHSWTGLLLHNPFRTALHNSFSSIFSI